MKRHLCQGLILKAIFTLNFICISVGATQEGDFSGLNKNEIEQVVNKALDTFNTPGMAVAIVHKNKIVHTAGYGYKNIENNALVDSNTLFRLASTSKAFTAASLAILVDDGVLNWDDKVTQYLPNFRMKDHWVTGEFTIGDLLTHKSGLVSSAGDSMLWPEPSGFTRDEVIHNLRHLTPEYSFRSTYAYSNVMYIAAGEIVAKVTNGTWENFVEQRIFKPLEMQCYAGGTPEAALNNIAMPYGYRNDKNYAIPRNGISGLTTVSAAAGGIVCNAQGMAKWIKMLLTEDEDLTSSRLFSKEQLSTMWQSRTILPMSKAESKRNRRHFRTYGYGWRKSDFLGYELISHTGTISGMQGYVGMIPELELGIVLLNNGSNSNARSSVMQTLLRSFIDEQNINKETDWVAEYFNESVEQEKRSTAHLYVPKGEGNVTLEEIAYIGIYEDQWFGKAYITQTESGLRFNFPKMTSLQGELTPFNGNSFVVHWDNKNAAQDAFVHFNVDVMGTVTSFTMYPYTLKEITSHEYKDMFFMLSDEK